MIRLKHRLRHDFIRTQKLEVNRIHRRLTNRVRKLLKAFRQNSLDKKLEGATPNQDSNFTLWRLTIRFKRQASSKFPNKQEDGS